MEISGGLGTMQVRDVNVQSALGLRHCVGLRKTMDPDTITAY